MINSNIMNYFLVMAICLMMVSCASLVPVTSPEDSFEQVLEFPGLSKDDLYLCANTWFVMTFTDAESVIQFSDKEGGRIAARCNVITDQWFYDGLEFGNRIKFSQVVLVNIKDGRLRLEITLLSFDPPHTALTYYERKFKIQGNVIDPRLMWEDLANSLYTYVNSENQAW